MYVKTDGQLKCIKKFELKSSLSTIFIHTEDEEGNLEIYKCPPISFNYKHIRWLFATDISIPGDLESGVWERGTRHLNASIKTINLAVTHKHITQ